MRGATLPGPLGGAAAVWAPLYLMRGAMQVGGAAVSRKGCCSSSSADHLLVTSTCTKKWSGARISGWMNIFGCLQASDTSTRWVVLVLLWWNQWQLLMLPIHQGTHTTTTPIIPVKRQIYLDEGPRLIFYPQSSFWWSAELEPAADVHLTASG